MLLYENGCFHVGGVSFVILNGFFLKTDPELCLSDGILLYSPDKSYSIELGIVRQEKGTKEFLMDFLSDMEELQVIEPISRVELNGLYGHHVTYKAGRTAYYEARFMIPEDYDRYTQFAVLTTVRNKEIAIQDIQKRPEYQELIQGIRRD